MHETSGQLYPAVQAYLLGHKLTDWQITGRGEEIDELRAGVDGLTSRRAISDWLSRAREVGIDPF
jgi:hypothetical protein